MIYRHKQKHNPNSAVRPIPPDKLERLLYGKPIPDQLIEKRLEEARQGTLIMPSIQEALTAAMQKQIKQTVNEWDDTPAPKPEPQPSKEQAMQTGYEELGVAQAVQKYVRDNPGHVRVQVWEGLAAHGYNRNSISSLINQNLRSGNFTEKDGMLYANFKEYRPVKPASKFMPPKKAAKKTKAAPVAASAPTAADLRNALSVIKQSKELYEELHKIFGDKV